MKGLKAGVIPCGIGTLDSNFMIAHDTVLTWENPTAQKKWFPAPLMIFVIKHPEAGWILWDMGSRIDSGEAWPKHITLLDRYEGSEDLRLEVQLEKLGIKPSDVNYVLLSHMHMDHTGYMHMFKDSAEFYVSRVEIMDACTAVLNAADVSTHGWYIRDEVLCPVKKYHYIDRDTEIFPGITLITLPGHTLGSLGCILELESGNRILTGDAVYGDYTFHGTLPGVVQDPVSYKESVRKIKAYQKQYGAEIWFSHDPAQFAKWKKIPHLY
jgi:glyoxylase-like metal-dependent hydrolase (beta-lactamase superfamily II)